MTIEPLEERLPGPETQLAQALAWLAAAGPRGAISAPMIHAIQEHHRALKTDPSVLVAAAVRYLTTRRGRPDDRLNRYWHIVDDVSAQTRARYQGVEPNTLK